MNAIRILFLVTLMASLGACVARQDTPSKEDTAPVPLTDLLAGDYLGFSGGLYPNRANALPLSHLNVGLDRALSIQPLDADGNPSLSGKYVLLSIGMSHVTQEFCSTAKFPGESPPCNPWTFMGQAAADASVNKSALVIVNGAAGGQDSSKWDSPDEATYENVRINRLSPLGLTEAQVQIVWMKGALAYPNTSLPSGSADAYELETTLGNVVRSLKIRYPNLKQVFISSRSFAGFAKTDLNPEPYAYETGFSVKWLIEAQINQMTNAGLVTDSRAGDLNDTTVAPWIAWGPYLWADGADPRSDGLSWLEGDFAADGTHPSQTGQQKVGTMLLNFFKTQPYTKCWFVTGATCP